LVGEALTTAPLDDVDGLDGFVPLSEPSPQPAINASSANPTILRIRRLCPLRQAF
jgi:hypothetical protein